MLTVDQFTKQITKDLTSASRYGFALLAEAVAKKAVGMFGNLDNGAGWDALSAKTIKNKASAYAGILSSMGFSASSPLVRTGGLMKSIEGASGQNFAAVGTNDPKMSFHELGDPMKNLPARPVFGHLVNHCGQDIEEAFAKAISESLGER